MSLKFVYALISNADDYYAEQTLISMYSFRRHNPDACVVLVTDSATLNSLTGPRVQIKEFASEIVTVEAPAGFTPKERSRYIKTTLRQTLTGDFMYLDNDTIVTGPLNDVEKSDCEMGAVLDCHIGAQGDWQLNDYLRRTNKKHWDSDMYFNGGVFYVKDTEGSRKLFADWHEIWDRERVEYGISIDQPALAQANMKNGFFISQIDDRYNCQMVMPAAKKYMFEAKVIHYYSDSARGDYFLPKRKEWLQKVKENGISDEVKKVISNPQTVYLESSRFMGGEELRIYYSPMVILAIKLSRDFPWTNKIAKFIYRLFGFKI